MPPRHPIFVLTVAALIGLWFGATPSAAQTLPNVIVTSLSYAGGIFTSTVNNQGTGATPAGTTIGVGYSLRWRVQNLGHCKRALGRRSIRHHRNQWWTLHHSQRPPHDYGFRR